MNSKPPHGPGPTAFRDVPGGMNPRSVQAQPMRQVSVPPALVQPPKRTHQTEGRVTVRLPDRVELNKAAVGAANLAEHMPVELISPRRSGGKQWLLDTRPTAPARLVYHDGWYKFTTASRIDRRYLQKGGTALRSKVEFIVGPELQEQVCIEVPATEYSPARTVCQLRGTGLYPLTPRRG